jgi:Escherichia/Staphylococcus phage prohead protease
MNDQIETRAATIAEVSYPKRMIELIVMPYERETTVARAGREWVEIVSRGAFDGVQRRTGDISVNRGHDLEFGVVGKTLALHPSREEGLIAEVRISRTDLGEETLVLADDGILKASAGFSVLRENGSSGPVKKQAEVWETRARRRLNHLWLDHVALTPQPAYREAEVLAVRNASEPAAVEMVDPTPNLDRMRLEEMRALRDALDRKYGLAR